MNIFFIFENFCENHPPTRHTQIKVINFPPSRKSVVEKELCSTIVNDFYDGLNLRLRVNSAKYIAR